MAAEKAEMDALKKECDGLRAQIEVSCVQMTRFALVKYRLQASEKCQLPQIKLYCHVKKNVKFQLMLVEMH